MCFTTFIMRWKSVHSAPSAPSCCIQLAQCMWTISPKPGTTTFTLSSTSFGKYKFVLRRPRLFKYICVVLVCIYMRTIRVRVTEVVCSAGGVWKYKPQSPFFHRYIGIATCGSARISLQHLKIRIYTNTNIYSGGDQLCDDPTTQTHTRRTNHPTLFMIGHIFICVFRCGAVRCYIRNIILTLSIFFFVGMSCSR